MNFQEQNIITMVPNEKLKIDNVTVHTVPAYNKNKQYHPKTNNWIGYVVTINNTIYYIMGDTDALEENEHQNCDYLFIPIGGTYTMNAKEAAKFTNDIDPKKVIPIHYGLVVGTKDDLDIFKSLLNKNIEIEEKIMI